jgi:hypothetical protein
MKVRTINLRTMAGRAELDGVALSRLKYTLCSFGPKREECSRLPQMTAARGGFEDVTT